MKDTSSSSIVKVSMFYKKQTSK